MIEIVVGEDDAPERLDKLIARHLRTSVMEARRLIERGKVRTSAGALKKGAVIPRGARVIVDAIPLSEGHRLAFLHAQRRFEIVFLRDSRQWGATCQ